ncbi:ABC-type Na+ efflux pump permease subunit [Halarchaeum rubridurum]|uniref:ABC transporter permease n=1 Tax=Halarchaeum rubridurum TaxID=489911 RepID=A0A830G2J1_9EURY|nr:ABC transporter permease [Halarchaeum rubridurum]MBP1955463.1 ABC-type Na+ efflux pump permease subunit [Halarchaeum rubridurum]GGM72549.1 ABC transporter permease [Halarchaeum rubridurum]
MNPRRVLRIARWEAGRNAGTVDRRTAILLACTVLVVALVAPALVLYAPTPGEGVYRVAVDDANPYHAPVAANDRLSVVPPGADAVERGRADVAVVGTGGFVVADSEKGRAALATLRSATEAYNDRLMATERDVAAAFPVTVDVSYVERGTRVVGGSDGGTASDGTSDDGAGAGADDGGATTDGDTGATESGTTTGSGAGNGASAPEATPSAGGDASAPANTPGGLTPPFPLESLLLAFVFVLPLNVVIQSYGSSVLDERIDRRGEPLLVSPATRADIVVGKALPYLAAAALVTVPIAYAVGAGVPAVLAVLPLAGLFLGVTFLGALFARSYKELTFVTVTVTVVLMAYAFVPAVFTEVHPIAAISPLSVVVRDIRGDPFQLGGFLLATVPVATAAVVCYGLGLGVYREEDLFTQKRLPAKALDALAAPLSSVRRVGLLTVALVPFVLIAELFAVAALFVAPPDLAVPLVLALVAVIEEVAKSVHVYAGFANARFERSTRTALALGVASGVGFFLGEKLLLLTRLVGLPDLTVGGAAFGNAELGAGSLALLVAPLLLHVVTASVSALGARRSARGYALALAGAVLLHLGYNYTVVSTLG